MSERVELTDGERAVMLAPCECGHDLDDHGGLAGCWTCADETPPRDCWVTFEALLIERQERIIAERVAEAVTDRDRLTEVVERAYALAGEWSERDATARTFADDLYAELLGGGEANHTAVSPLSVPLTASEGSGGVVGRSAPSESLSAGDRIWHFAYCRWYDHDRAGHARRAEVWGRVADRLRGWLDGPR